MEASETNQATTAWYVAAVIIPIVGIILAIIQFNRNHVGPAFGLLLTSLVAAIVWSALLLMTYSATHESANTDRYTKCVMQAQTYKEQLNCPL